jgi:putative spermidine/putrescine transport system permease protein
LLVSSLLLVLIPVMAGILYALGYSTGLIGVLSTGFTWRYWHIVLCNTSFWFSLLFSLFIGIISIALATTVAMMLVLRYKIGWLKKGKRFIISVPLVIPPVVTAFLLLQWFSKSGLASRICYHLGLVNSLQKFPDLVNDKWGLGLIFAHVLLATPFFTLLFANIYKDTNMEEYHDLSSSIGASNVQYYKRVLFPILFRQSLPNMLLYIIFVMGSYEIPLILGRSYPQMLTVYAVQKLNRYNLDDKPQAYVITILFTGLVMAALTLVSKLQKSFSERE